MTINKLLITTTTIQKTAVKIFTLSHHFFADAQKIGPAFLRCCRYLFRFVSSFMKVVRHFCCNNNNHKNKNMNSALFCIFFCKCCMNEYIDRMERMTTSSPTTALLKKIAKQNDTTFFQ